MAQGTQVAGKNAKLLSGSTQINVKNWTLTHANDELDVTHTGSGGTRAYISGLSGAEGSFEMDFDPNSPYYDTTRNVVPGRTFTMNAYIDPNRFYAFKCQITSVEPSVDVEGVVGIAVNFVASETITPPTG